MQREKILRVSIFLATAVLFTSTVSSVAVVNSQDWKDVYSGISYSYDQGHEDVFFPRSSSATGLMKKLPKGDPVVVINSEDTPVSSNLVERLKSNGYSIERTINGENLNLQLTSGKEKYIVVPGDFPSVSLAVAPVAESRDAGVLILEEGNLDEISSRLEGPGDMIVGVFNRDEMEALGPVAEQEVLEGNRFNLSVKLTRRFLDGKNAERAFVSSGKFIESEMLKGEMPVLLSGTNLVSEPVEDFLLQDPDHGVRTVIMTGNELTSVGKDIRDRNITRDGETTDEKIRVFVKYGTARGDSNQIYSIGLFPLPQGDINLQVDDVRYDPEEKTLYITYMNTGKNKMYSLTSLRILKDGKELATASDGSPMLIGGEDSKTVSYSVNLDSGYQGALVEFSTSFGESPNNLDTYLTEEGRFSPPLQKNLTVEKVEDSSNITLESIAYMKGVERFRLKVENHRSSPGYVSVSLRGVEIRGEEQSMSSDLEEIPGEETGYIYIPAELDRIDLRENEKVRAVLDYGESEDVQPHLSDRPMDLEVREKSLVSSAFSEGASLIALSVATVILLVAIWKKEILLQRIDQLR